MSVGMVPIVMGRRHGTHRRGASAASHDGRPGTLDWTFGWSRRLAGAESRRLEVRFDAVPEDPWSQTVAQISALIARYSECIDSGDLEGLADLLADAGFGAAEGPLVHGRDNILKLYEKTVRIYDDGTPRTKHLVTNLVIDVDPACETASARSYWTVLQATPDMAPRPDPVGALPRSLLNPRRDLAIHRTQDHHRPGRRREPPHAPGGRNGSSAEPIGSGCSGAPSAPEASGLRGPPCAPRSL